MTGLCALGERTPIITRPPCTDGSDGMVVQVVQNESDLIGPNASAMFKFLSNLTFCAVIFPLGIPSLPSRINDGDCDGDLYFILWNEKLVAQAENNYEAVADEFVYENDALVGTSVCCEGEGNKQATGVVVGKATGKDMYLVEVESKSKKNTMENGSLAQRKNNERQGLHQTSYWTRNQKYQNCVPHRMGRGLYRA